MRYRCHLFASEADPTARPWVVSLFQAFGTGGPDAESLNCSTPLVSAADPTGPVVALCCSFVLGEETLSALLALADAGQVPAGVVYAVCDEIGPEEGRIRHTNYQPETYVGLMWDMPTTLTVIGLAFKPSRMGGE